MPFTIKLFSRFSKKNIPQLHYGIIHSRFGFSDGVSIVMRQIEDVMVSDLQVPKENLFYLVGKSRIKGNNITERECLLDGNFVNSLAVKNFSFGFGGNISECIESSISQAKKYIEDFVRENKIDVIIAHNTSHPVNFVLSVALSRFYRDYLKKRVRTPKYILWWHDSHVERKYFSKPSNDVKRYLLEGVPGRHVEFIFFINTIQFKEARKYFLELDKLKIGFCSAISRNNDVIYNTVDRFIETYSDLESEKQALRVKKFLNDFAVEKLLKKNGFSIDDTVFCIQHTRIVDRKRIDFALDYCFALLQEINRNKKRKKALYFFVSGNDSGDGSKKKVIDTFKMLSKGTGEKIFLNFADDFYDKTDIMFEEYPRIFARLGGFATYFSEIEGFGNNLLELLASGLIPVVYTYPVFVKDIAKNNFKVVALKKFDIDLCSVRTIIRLLGSQRMRKIWANKNLAILRKNFNHKLISLKLARGIMRKRLHK